MASPTSDLMPQRSDRRTVLVVETAMDGAAGLEGILTIFPNLVLLDLEMPIMNGLEVLRILAQLGHGVPVIVMSAVLERYPARQATVGKTPFKPSGYGPDHE